MKSDTLRVGIAQYAPKWLDKKGTLKVIGKALMRREDFPSNTPYISDLIEKIPAILANGGSCIAGPHGEWVLTDNRYRGGYGC